MSLTDRMHLADPEGEKRSRYDVKRPFALGPALCPGSVEVKMLHWFCFYSIYV